MGRDADVVRRLTDEVFIGGNVEAIDQLLSSDFESHDPPPGVGSDRQGLKDLASMVVGSFDDRKLEFDEFIDTTDGRVVENWAMTATHTGEAFGLPPSGKSITVRGIEIWRVSNGRIVEHWGAVDMSDLAEKALA